jgi:hypothetical protein
MTFLGTLGDDGVPPWDFDLDRHLQGQFCGLGCPVRRLHNDAAARDTWMQALKVVNALTDERFPRAGGNDRSTWSGRGRSLKSRRSAN